MDVESLMDGFFPKFMRIRSLEERDELVQRWIPLVYSRVRKLQARYTWVRLLDRDDAVNAGMVGLIRAADLFDPRKISESTGKPIRFSTYAVRAIDQHIRREAAGSNIISGAAGYAWRPEFTIKDDSHRIQVHVAQSFPKSLSQRYDGDGGFCHEVVAAESVVDSVDAEERYRDLYDKLDHLLPRYAILLRGFWLEGKTLREMSDIHMISKERIRQLLLVAENSLRKAYGLNRGRMCKCGEPVAVGDANVSCRKCRRNKVFQRVKKQKRKVVCGG